RQGLDHLALEFDLVFLCQSSLPVRTARAGHRNLLRFSRHATNLGARWRARARRLEQVQCFGDSAPPAPPTVGGDSLTGGGAGSRGGGLGASCGGPTGCSTAPAGGLAGPERCDG